MRPGRIAEIKAAAESEDRTALSLDNIVDELLAEVERLQLLLATTAQDASTVARLAARHGEWGPLMLAELQADALRFYEIAKQESPEWLSEPPKPSLD